MPLTALPNDTLIILLSHLDGVDLSSACRASRALNDAAPEAARRRLELRLNRIPGVRMMAAAARRGRHLIRVLAITEYRLGLVPAPRAITFGKTFLMAKVPSSWQDIEGWPVNFIADSFERWRDAQPVMRRWISDEWDGPPIDRASAGYATMFEVAVFVSEVASFEPVRPLIAGHSAAAWDPQRNLLGVATLTRAVLSREWELQTLRLAKPRARALLRADAPGCIALALRWRKYKDRPSEVVKHAHLPSFVIHSWPQRRAPHPPVGWTASPAGQALDTPPPAPPQPPPAASTVAQQSAAAARAAKSRQSTEREALRAALAEQLDPADLAIMALDELRALSKALHVSGRGEEEDE